MAKHATITKETFEWFQMLAERGIFVVDAQGKGCFSPSIMNIVNGLNEILAGGEVQVTIKTPGTPKVKEELERKLNAAIASVNAANIRPESEQFTP